TISLHHNEQVRQRVPRLEPDTAGIIAHAHTPKLFEALSRCGVPFVNTSAMASARAEAAVVPDNAAIGRMAAESMLGLGHRRLLTLAITPWSYSLERVAAFHEVAEAAGARVRRRVFRSWARAEREIAEVLAEAATPLGVFASSDGMAVFVVRQCLALGLAIPEQVAVLGVDNDTLTTRMVSPTISSIEVPWEKLGFEAAAMLDRQTRGQPIGPGPVTISPTRVITRQSTDSVAIADREVAQAVRFIREHVGEAVTIQQVLDHVPVSRRALERRFKVALGRTLQTHITHVRLEQAKRMLTDTNYPMPEIARRCGFSEPGYFATVFKSHTGQSPTAFRSAYRLA
ncbi:MAG: substrate-binding domain-containing protein, partial [Planctomycetota bacterium]